MFSGCFKTTFYVTIIIISQLTYAAKPLSSKAMGPADKNYAITSVINGDVYFYGFNQDFKDVKVTDLDKNGVADWGGEDKLQMTFNPSGIVDGNDKVLKTSTGSNGLLQQLGFNTGNAAFSAEVLLKINGPQKGSFDAAWGMVNNNKSDSRGSKFLIADDHIQVGDKKVSTEDNTGKFNYFRYCYLPTGRNDGTGTIFIYRNGKLLGFFSNKIGAMDPRYEWFGDWTGALDGGYSICYISFTAGCHAQEKSLQPTVIDDYKSSKVCVRKVNGTLHGCHGKPHVYTENLRKVKMGAKGGGYKYESPSFGKIFVAITVAIKSGYSISLLDYSILTANSSSPCIGIRKYESPAFNRMPKELINKSKNKMSCVLLFEVDPSRGNMSVVSNLQTTVKMSPLSFELSIQN